MPLHESGTQPTPSEIDVAMGTYDLSADEKIGTGGLGPCLGLALHDPNNQVGWVVHTNAWDHTALNKMLGRMAGVYQDFSTLSAWISGGERDYQNHATEESLLAARQAVIDRLTGLGIPEERIKPDWINDPDEIGRLILDPMTGICIQTKRSARAIARSMLS